MPPESPTTAPVTKSESPVGAFDLERVLELARQLAPVRGAFDDSLGPEEDCFSSGFLLYALTVGVFGEHLTHLLRCAVCRRNIGLLSSLRLSSPPGFIALALEKVVRGPTEGEPSSSQAQAQQGGQSASAADEGRPLLALLGRESEVVYVALKRGITLSLTFVLVPAFGAPSLVDVCEESLRLEGAVASAQGRITDRTGAGSGYLGLTFTEVTVAAHVRQHLGEQRPVTDTVRLVGSFQGQTRSFEARARLVFDIAVGAALLNALQEWRQEHPDQAPAYIARELMRDTLEGDWRNALVVTAEDCPFSEPEQQRKVGERLLRIAAELRETAGEGEEKVVWSALRRGTSLLPLQDAGRLLPFLKSGEKPSTRMVALQSLARRFEADLPVEGGVVGAELLRSGVADCAAEFLAPQKFRSGTEAAIALNAVHALAALGDARLERCISSVQALERSWLTGEVRQRLEGLLGAWKARGETALRSQAFGLLQSQLAKLG
jgi:hypothetical protein